MTDTVLARVAALKTTPTPQLKAQWRELFQSEPPPYNRRFLESRLAYRIQELSYGGLKPETLAPPPISATTSRQRRVRGSVPMREWPICSLYVLSPGESNRSSAAVAYGLAASQRDRSRQGCACASICSQLYAKHLIWLFFSPKRPHIEVHEPASPRSDERRRAPL